ncbi:replicative DNA helicase [Candidatus Parcubacteria bacterium]|nr:MAG: replicative DNA helicase [Candidatus Parcubacteria bacterium]
MALPEKKKLPNDRNSAPKEGSPSPIQFSRVVRVPPQDVDMERALLGSLMLSQNAMYEVADLVGVDSFYAGKHRTIFDAMLSLHAKGEPIDVVTVSSKLKERKLLAEVGGAAYLSELAGAAASPGSSRHYAQNVQAKYVLRSLIEAAAKIGELGFEEDREIEEVLDEAQAAIFSVSQAPMLRNFSSIKEELTEAWDRLEHLQKHEATLRGVPSGFSQLDNLLAGFQKSDLILLAARPSMGKTALALDIARQTATKHGTAVGMFSLEMSSQQLVDRMLAAQAGVNSWKLRTGKIKSEEEFDRLQEGMGILSEAPIYIDDKASSTVLQMRSVARRLKIEKGLGLIVIDYLQLITPTHSRGGDSMVQQITEISRSLKAMARELDVPVLALSQLSRAVEQRRGRPRLSDLRDSGSLEQDADVVMFIHRDDKMNENSDRPGVAEILIEKHRNGPTGKVELHFDEEKTTFRSIEKSDFGDFTPEAEVSDSPF